MTENDPGGHGLGMTAPSRLEKYPASTIFGALWPAGQKYPGGQEAVPVGVGVANSQYVPSLQG